MPHLEPNAAHNPESKDNFPGRKLARDLDANPDGAILVESWAETQPWKDLPDIPELRVDLERYKYCSQGKVVTSSADQALQIGSDGFSKCSGVVVCERDSGNVIFAHADPGEDNLYEVLKELRGILLNVTLVQGDQSVFSAGLEEYIAENPSEISSVRRIHVTSGDQSFGIVYDQATNQLRVITRSPEQTAYTYQL